MSKQDTNPAIQKVFNLPETLSAEEKARRLAEMRANALRNKAWELFEAKEEGRKEGRKEVYEEGLAVGELIGEIRVLQRFLKYPISSREELAAKSINELTQILQEMESALN